MENENKNIDVDKPDQSQEKDQGKGKLFTQEEVNELIKKRLARVKAGKGEEDLQSEKNNISQREKDLTARESKLSCKEYLFESGLPLDLLDVIDTSDVDKFKERADILKDRIIGSMKQISYPEVRDGCESGIKKDTEYARIKAAFSPDLKRKPKDIYPYW